MITDEALIDKIDKQKMAELLEDDRRRFLNPSISPQNDTLDQVFNVQKDDVLKLMESTGRIRQGEKVFGTFAKYVKQRSIYDQKIDEWKMKKTSSPKRDSLTEEDLSKKNSRDIRRASTVISGSKYYNRGADLAYKNDPKADIYKTSYLFQNDEKQALSNYKTSLFKNTETLSYEKDSGEIRHMLGKHLDGKTNNV